MIKTIDFKDAARNLRELLEDVRNGGNQYIIKANGQKMAVLVSLNDYNDFQQLLLESARLKILAINQNIRTSQGLTHLEVEVAAKAGLIDPEQKWWWTEEWQKGEREAEEDIQAGRVSGPFKSADELLKHLKSQKL